MVPNYGLKLLSGPGSEPLSLAEAQQHLRIIRQDGDETAWLTATITACRRWYEDQTDRALVQQTFLMAFDAFPGRTIDEYRPPGWRYGIIRVPRAPLVSVTTLQYIDTNGVLQTLDPSQYQVDAISEPGRVAPARFLVWPVTDPLSFNAVQLTFVCGYTTPPEDCKIAVKLLVAHCYQNREATVEGALSKVPFSLMSFVRQTGYGEYV